MGFEKENSSKKMRIFKMMLKYLFVLYVVSAVFISIIFLGKFIYYPDKTTTQDYIVKAKLLSIAYEAKLYFEKNKTFVNFTTDASWLGCEQSMKPIMNISPDGQKVAIFGKSCSRENAYYCYSNKSEQRDFDSPFLVKKEYIDEKNAICP